MGLYGLRYLFTLGDRAGLLAETPNGVLCGLGRLGSPGVAGGYSRKPLTGFYVERMNSVVCFFCKLFKTAINLKLEIGGRSSRYFRSHRGRIAPARVYHVANKRPFGANRAQPFDYRRLGNTFHF